MPRAATTRLDEAPIDLLELISGLAAVVAGVLWLSVYLLTEGAPELCSTPPSLLGHCLLCYPAAAATVAAVVGWGALIWRRRA